MTISDLEREILVELYEIQFVQNAGGINYSEWADEKKKDKNQVYRAVEELEDKRLAEAPALGPVTAITSHGIDIVEKNTFVKKELIQKQHKFRLQFLDELAKVRDENGLNAFAFYIGILQEIDAEEMLFDSNYSYLNDCGVLEQGAAGTFRITTKGYGIVKEWRKHRGTADKYEELVSGENITPQKRGHELEKLLQQVFERDGWTVERNAIAPGEENDLIVHKELEFFIVSAKWEKKTIEAGVVRDLRDRVTGRPGVKGILVSMSGFSSNAADLARERMESAVILLLGPEDIKSIFTKGSSITDLLSSKIRALVIEKKIVWE